MTAPLSHRFMRLTPAALQRLLAPGYSTCSRCERPWKYVEAHATYYTTSNGCFPLCEDCWQDLSVPARRLPYYRQLWLDWGADRATAKWDDIEAAVLAGR